MPTKVGIQRLLDWIPTFVGMTDYRCEFFTFINDRDNKAGNYLLCKVCIFSRYRR